MSIVFNIAVLIEGTINRQTNIANRALTTASRRLLAILHHAVEELNSGLQRTNPVSGKVEDLCHGPPEFKRSTFNHSAMLLP